MSAVYGRATRTLPHGPAAPRGALAWMPAGCFPSSAGPERVRKLAARAPHAPPLTSRCPRQEQQQAQQQQQPVTSAVEYVDTGLYGDEKAPQVR